MVFFEIIFGKIVKTVYFQQTGKEEYRDFSDKGFRNIIWHLSMRG